MKYFIIILFAFTLNAQDGVTRFFVNRDAGGSANGTSWTNAWLNPDDIDFSVLTAGDTVYVSGGTDSTTYYPNSVSGIVLGNISSGSGVYTFASGNPVVICPSWEANHNGDVYLSCLNAHTRVLAVGNISNVKVTGFTLYDNRTQNIEGGSMVQLGNADWDGANGGTIDSLITLDNCHIVSKGFASLITLSGCKSTFSNNYQETISNEYGYEQDQFGINGGRGGHTITGNIMIARNHLTDTSFSSSGEVEIDGSFLSDNRLSMGTNQYLGASVKVGDAYLQIVTNTSTVFNGTGWVNYDEDGNPSPAETPPNGSAWELVSDAHRDGIQISNIGYVYGADSLWRLNNERLDFTIANNLYIDYHEGGSHQNNMLYNYGWIVTTDVRFLIYNNIFVNRKNQSGIGGIAIGRYYVGAYSEFNSIHILNNTLISAGTSGSMFTFWSADTLVMANNLWVKDLEAPNILNLENGQSLWDDVARYIDYNRYFEYGGQSNPFAANVDSTDWADWNDNFDQHSDYRNSTEVTFTSKYGLTKQSYYTTAGRDSAIDLSATYPFLSTDALGNSRSGTWDIGALEYQSGVPTPRAVRMRQIIIQ